MLVPWLAQATKHLGLVPTLSVTEYPPYLLARLVNSLDHVTEGRVGWNCVTGSNDGAAQNYGHDKHLPHDERYDVADEFADVVTRLWEAWEPDAVVLDRETPMFADGAKVHPINHEGKYFKVRGPLNAPRSPQGRVPICQAGGSPRGQEFASRWADTIITDGGGSAASMKAYRDGSPPDARRRSAAIPTTSRCCSSPIRSSTPRWRPRASGAARGGGSEKHRRDGSSPRMSRLTGIDFSRFDLDEPLPASSRPTATSPRSPSGSARRRASWCAPTPARTASTSPARPTTSPA